MPRTTPLTKPSLIAALLAAATRWLRHIAQRSPSLRQGQIIALACTAVAIISRAVLDPYLDGSGPFVTFLPAMLIASVWGGASAGISTLVLGAIAVAFVWLPPVWSLSLTAPSQVALVGYLLLGAMIIGVAALYRALVTAQAASEARATILAGEMRHRVGNMLALVQAISYQTSRTAATVADYHHLLEARLVALGQAQALVDETPDLPPDLRTLLDRILEPFGAERFDLAGPPTPLRDDLGTSLALLIHELGTNAIKHGSLSVPEGRVVIRWMADQGGMRLDWRETNGPPVAEPVRTGFGSRLLRMALPREKGEASIRYQPEGVHCTIRLVALP